MGILAVPFDIATDGIRHQHAGGRILQVLNDGPFQVVDSDLLRLARLIDCPTRVDQPASRIENVKVRRP